MDTFEGIRADLARLMIACKHPPEASPITIMPPASGAMPSGGASQNDGFRQESQFSRVHPGGVRGLRLVGKRSKKLLCDLASVSGKMDKPRRILEERLVVLPGATVSFRSNSPLLEMRSRSPTRSTRFSVPTPS